jgi:hypothetical protein
VEKQQELIRGVFSVLCSRPENVSNFLEIESLFGPDSRLVYKHYATLYFVLVFDGSENELAMLDLIQGPFLITMVLRLQYNLKWHGVKPFSIFNFCALE